MIEYYWAHRVVIDPLPTLPDNPKAILKTTFLHLFTPPDMLDTMMINTRYMDINKSDDGYLWYSQFRRIRRMQTTQRQDTIAGTDLVYDDEYHWDNHIPLNTCKLVGTKDMLCARHLETETSKTYQRVEGQTVANGIPRERVKVLVIEAYNKDPDYVYKRRVLYLDPESYISYWSQMYDNRDRFWKAFEFYSYPLKLEVVIRFFDKKGLGSNINDWVTNGLSVAPYYVKTVPATNTFTISATDGGATVTTTAISSPEAILFMCRYGTPLNVTIANNTAHGPLNVNAGGGAGDVARIVFHTHPEGYGVAFLNNTITVTVQNASVGSAAFSCLSRSTKIMNNVLLGNFATPFASPTNKDFFCIEYSGNDAVIQGNVIEGFGVAISTRDWWGAAVGGANATGGKRANISNNVIRNINYAVFWAVDVTGGTSALGSNLVFHNNLLCGTIHYSNAGAAAQIAILCPGMINTRWTNNYIEKMYASVDLMNTSTITDTQILDIFHLSLLNKIPIQMDRYFAWFSLCFLDKKIAKPFSWL